MALIIEAERPAARARSSEAACVGAMPAVPLILRMLCDVTGLGFATVTHLTETEWNACAVLDRIAYGIEAWTQCDISNTLCRTVRQTRQPIVIEKASSDPVFRHHPAPAAFGFESYVGVPILRGDGTIFGTICALDPEAKLRQTPELVPTLELFAEMVSIQLAAEERLVALTHSQQRLGFALKAGRLGNWELNLATGRLQVSDICAQNFGLHGGRELTRYTDLEHMVHPDDLPRHRAMVRRALDTHEDLDIEYRNLWPDGSVHWIRVMANCIRNDAGVVVSMVGLSVDVTARRAAEAELLHLAHHDPLTDLANRRLIDQRLNEALARDAGQLALICIDLDQFKTVNDSFGHAAGDTVLRAVAARLLSCVATAGQLARFGGDEFAVLITDGFTRDQVERLAAKIVDVLARPHEIDGRQIIVGGSVGVAMAPADGVEINQLWRHADAAMYRAKSSGRGRYRFFDASMDRKRHQIEELRMALPFVIQRHEMQLFYQPIVDLLTGTPVCFEALLRWQHPTLGLLSPIEFIGLAEESGLIVQLGAMVLRSACRQAASWPGQIAVSVNLSAVQFSEADLVADVVAALAASGLEPHRLELEVTETVLLQDSDTNRRILGALRGLGVQVVLDDFGTGYSSLEYLRRFKFDKMKIDKSLLLDLPDHGRGDIIVRGIIGLGGDLRIPITIEGVETAAQLQFLRGTGCRQAQGYLFSRPVPASKLPQLLAAPLPCLEPSLSLHAHRRQVQEMVR